MIPTFFVIVPIAIILVGTIIKFAVDNRRLRSDLETEKAKLEVVINEARNGYVAKFWKDQPE